MFQENHKVSHQNSDQWWLKPFPCGLYGYTQDHWVLSWSSHPITATPFWRQCEGFCLASQYVPPPWIKIPPWILLLALFLGLSNSKTKLGTWSPSRPLHRYWSPKYSKFSILYVEHCLRVCFMETQLLPARELWIQYIFYLFPDTSFVHKLTEILSSHSCKTSKW